jgi:glycosyltransferase involved in cell wall biosynthesis
MTVLGVFFTRGVSLRQWLDSGLFDREVLIYQHHLNSGQFDEIVWFTYGVFDADAARTLQAQGRLPQNIRVVPMPAWVSMFRRAASLIYTFMMPLVVRNELERCYIFKTNQMDGALAAVIASKLLKRPLYLRTGYTLSIFVDRIHPRNPLRRGFAWMTEIIAFRHCAAASVSSQYDRDYVVRRYALSSAQPAVIGNYIDVQHFSPRPDVQPRERMVFVGRLSAQKNLEAAIRASALVGVGLDIIGDGPCRDKLQSLAERLGADIQWLGLLPNDDLPNVLADYRYFLMPSLWEGMPKALLEAMAAGMICIGNNALGINEVIRDGVTGYLSSGPEARDLALAIRRAMAEDQVAIAAAAREFICENFSLEVVAARESAIFKRLPIMAIDQGTAG